MAPTFRVAVGPVSHSTIESDNMLSRHDDLISALTSLPESELAAVVAVALEKRAPEVGRPGGKEARARLSNAAADRDTRATRETGCCGLAFTSQAERILCPLCGRTAKAAPRTPARLATHP